MTEEVNSTVVNTTVNSTVPDCANHTTTHDLKQNDLLSNLYQPQVFIAFLIGMLLSATICCLVTKCQRKKRRGSRNRSENLEMLNSQAVPLVGVGLAVRDHDGDTHDQEEVAYSNIDFSKLKRTSPTETKETQRPSETEYAEIQRETIKEADNSNCEESEVSEGNRESWVTAEVEKEAEQCEAAQAEGGEDSGLYSQVNKIRAQT